MSIEIKIPDIGDFDAVDVIEVNVAVGDKVNVDDTLITLESDKASMEVPATEAGVVERILVKVGDKVKEGDVILVLASDVAKSEVKEEKSESKAEDSTATASTAEFLVPDIGDFDAVDVIEVNVAVGDKVKKDDTLITLESDKASMEVPAEFDGEILALNVKVGDKVKKGSVIAKVSTTASNTTQTAPQKTENAPVKKESAPTKAAETKSAASTTVATNAIDEDAFAKAYASPAVRRLARELGANLGVIQGTGRNQRILEDDVKSWVKQTLQQITNQGGQGSVGSGIPAIPAVDFSKFGEIEEQALSRINVLTGEAMTRCWLNIPHVTQHDKYDITDLEEFRKSLKNEAEKKGVRVTMLAFLMKALVIALKEFPRFNSSLSQDGKSLILKKYYNVGVAVDTPNGLVVPVIRDVDQKGIYELSADLMAISKKARDGKLSPKDMSGASMTISSLGGIGGEYFTPIVNAPEVAILGVSRSKFEPVWNGKEFVPRLMLPLSMSYDHRVIDGALGARMLVFLGQLLNDMRRTLL